MTLEAEADQGSPLTVQRDVFTVVDQGCAEEVLWRLLDGLESVNPPRVAALIHDYVSNNDEFCTLFTATVEPGMKRSVLVSAFLELAQIPWALIRVGTDDSYYLVRIGFSQEHWCPQGIGEQLQAYYRNQGSSVKREYRFEEWRNLPFYWFPCDSQASHVGDVRGLKFHGYACVRGDEWELVNEDVILSTEDIPH